MEPNQISAEKARHWAELFEEDQAFGLLPEMAEDLGISEKKATNIWEAATLKAQGEGAGSGFDSFIVALIHAGFLIAVEF